MDYINGMETAFPVRKALQFTAEQWEDVRTFRFDQKIGTEAEAVRRLIEIGWETYRPLAEDVKRAERAFEEARKSEPVEKHGIYLDKLTSARDALHDRCTPRPDGPPNVIIEDSSQ